MTCHSRRRFQLHLASRARPVRVAAELRPALPQHAWPDHRHPCPQLPQRRRLHRLHQRHPCHPPNRATLDATTRRCVSCKTQAAASPTVMATTSRTRLANSRSSHRYCARLPPHMLGPLVNLESLLRCLFHFVSRLQVPIMLTFDSLSVEQNYDFIRVY